jgi:LacI family transcriptional regulator
VVILTSTIVKGLREMLQGVLQYAQEKGPWRIYQQENRRWLYELHDLKRWGCTGVIAADYHSAEEARQIAAQGVPLIVLLQPHPMRQRSYPLFRHPCVVWASAAIGRMAAEYFVERHYTQFAFVGDTHPETYWSVDRERSFRASLRAAGHRVCHVYGACSAKEQRDWAVERPRMEAWLCALPKPIALFAPNDRRGKQVLDACMDAGVSVPDEVAVLGVDNDEWICEASVPTLSSIQCDPRPAGYRIAEHLDRLMKGERLEKREYLVEPIRVVTRQSTEWTAIADQKMACALRFIQISAHDPNLRVMDIAKSAGLSRRATEIRFLNATGRTLREEIEHVRLERLRALLVETDLNIGDLALRCGFACETHLGRIFRKRFGVTMGQFRSETRNLSLPTRADQTRPAVSVFQPEAKFL